MAEVAPQITADTVAVTQTAQAAAVVAQVADQTPKAAAVVVAKVVDQDPNKAAAVVAKLAVQQPRNAKAVVTEVSNQHPSQAARLFAVLAQKHPAEAAKLGLSSLAGSWAIADLGGYLTTRNQVATIANTAKQVAAVRKEAGLKAAAGQALAENGQKSLTVDRQAKLDTWSRLGAGLAMLNGVNALMCLPDDLRHLHRQGGFANSNAVASDGINLLRGANEGVKLLRNTPVGFISARWLPGVSLGADATDAVRRVLALRKAGQPGNERVSNAAFLAGDSIDAIGSGLMLSGAGLPLAAALKLVAGGLFVSGIAAQHAHELGKLGQKIGRGVRDFAQRLGARAPGEGRA